MKNTDNKPAFDLRQPVQFLALGFGSGLAPKAPGTFGTLAAIPLFLLLTMLMPTP
jgi:phosphatidylglycerophosphatase A